MSYNSGQHYSKLCTMFQQGKCFNDMCQYSHTLPDKPQGVLEFQRKKLPCRDFPSGNCKFGDNCRFSHDAENSEKQDDESKPQNTQNKKVCKLFAQYGNCKFGDGCMFSHEGIDQGKGGQQDGDEEETRSKPRKDFEGGNDKKKGICNHFQKFGKCKYGDECTFAHETNGANNEEKPSGKEEQSTQICDHFQKFGRCKFGDDCKFSHDKSANNNEREDETNYFGAQKQDWNQAEVPTYQQQSAKRNICRNFQQFGKCKFGDDCKFEHVHPDQQIGIVSSAIPAAALGASKGPCKYFQQGSCSKGKNCEFSHESISKLEEKSILKNQVFKFSLIDIGKANGLLNPKEVCSIRSRQVIAFYENGLLLLRMITRKARERLNDAKKQRLLCKIRETGAMEEEENSANVQLVDVSQKGLILEVIRKFNYPIPKILADKVFVCASRWALVSFQNPLNMSYGFLVLDLSLCQNSNSSEFMKNAAAVSVAHSDEVTCVSFCMNTEAFAGIEVDLWDHYQNELHNLKRHGDTIVLNDPINSHNQSSHEPSAAADGRDDRNDEEETLIKPLLELMQKRDFLKQPMKGCKQEYIYKIINNLDYEIELMKGDLPASVQEILEQQLEEQEEEEKLNHEERQQRQNDNAGNQIPPENNPVANNNNGDNQEQQQQQQEQQQGDELQLRRLNGLSKAHQKLVDEIKKKEKLLKKYQDIYDSCNDPWVDNRMEEVQGEDENERHHEEEDGDDGNNTHDDDNDDDEDYDDQDNQDGGSDSNQQDGNEQEEEDGDDDDNPLNYSYIREFDGYSDDEKLLDKIEDDLDNSNNNNSGDEMNLEANSKTIGTTGKHSDLADKYEFSQLYCEAAHARDMEQLLLFTASRDGYVKVWQIERVLVQEASITNEKSTNITSNAAPNKDAQKVEEANRLHSQAGTKKQSTRVDRKLVFKLKLMEGLAYKITETITKKSVVKSMLQLTMPKQISAAYKPEFTRLLLLGGEKGEMLSVGLNCSISKVSQIGGENSKLDEFYMADQNNQLFAILNNRSQEGSQLLQIGYDSSHLVATIYGTIDSLHALIDAEKRLMQFYYGNKSQLVMVSAPLPTRDVIVPHELIEIKGLLASAAVDALKVGEGGGSSMLENNNNNNNNKEKIAQQQQQKSVSFKQIDLTLPYVPQHQQVIKVLQQGDQVKKILEIKIKNQSVLFAFVLNKYKNIAQDAYLINFECNGTAKSENILNLQQARGLKRDDNRGMQQRQQFQPRERNSERKDQQNDSKAQRENNQDNGDGQADRESSRRNGRGAQNNITAHLFGGNSRNSNSNNNRFKKQDNNRNDNSNNSHHDQNIDGQNAQRGGRQQQQQPSGGNGRQGGERNWRKNDDNNEQSQENDRSRSHNRKEPQGGNQQERYPPRANRGNERRDNTAVNDRGTGREENQSRSRDAGQRNTRQQQGDGYRNRDSSSGNTRDSNRAQGQRGPRNSSNPGNQGGQFKRSNNNNFNNNNNSNNFNRNNNNNNNRNGNNNKANTSSWNNDKVRQ